MKFVVVDAFTSAPFSGNQACVVVLQEPKEEQFMKMFAREMNLSETTYLQKLGPNKFSIRWFTPTVEVDLCGHATLAAAHVLFSTVDGDKVTFESKSGELSATLVDSLITLSFPEEPFTPYTGDKDLLCSSLGLPGPESAEFIGQNRMDAFVAIPGGFQAVLDVKPDLDKMLKVGTRCVIVSSATPDHDRYDCVSRVFGPCSGIPEDPVTGSAHCGIGPYWAGRLGKTVVDARQASARGGDITVDVAAQPGRVLLQGNAVTVTRGEYVAS